MNSLKNALSTQESPPREKGQCNGSLLKGVNKSKNASLWSLDVDTNEQATQQSLDTDNLMKILNQKLQSAFQKDSKNISEITFQRIVQQFQDDAGGKKSQLSYLMVIQDKLSDIMQFAKEDFKKYLNLFNQMLENKINRLKKKQKKYELSNYEKIVSGNFKKKAEDTPYLAVQENKPLKLSKDKGKKLCSKSPRKENSSHQNKLARLFSKDKNPLKEKQLKQSVRRQDQNPVFNATQVHKDQSVSFSNVLATSVAVKSRRRKSPNEFQQKKVKPKIEQKNEAEKEEGDEAFMFFRPKKGKK